MAQGFCAGCGKQTDSSGFSCPHCGTTAQEVPEKSKTKAALLAFFFGMVGAHYFYLGNVFIGSMNLLLFFLLYLPSLVFIIFGDVLYPLMPNTRLLYNLLGIYPLVMFHILMVVEFVLLLSSDGKVLGRRDQNRLRPNRTLFDVSSDGFYRLRAYSLQWYERKAISVKHPSMFLVLPAGVFVAFSLWAIAFKGRMGSASAVSPNVYVAVVVAPGSADVGGQKCLTLWRNGTPQCLSQRLVPPGLLSDSGPAVFVSERGVFVAGTEHAGVGRFATVWANGEPLRLYGRGYSTGANSVFAFGPDLYVAGYEITAQGREAALIWKNGEPMRLSFGRHGVAHSVFVSAGDVYVAGYEEAALGRQFATLWKNGEPQYLSSGRMGVAHSVFVSGGDVYVAGTESTPQGRFPTIWKNGDARRLSPASSLSVARSVFVSGGDVYVAGYAPGRHGPDVPAVWKNGVMQELAVPRRLKGVVSVRALSVAVKDGCVYAAGGGGGHALLWEDGRARMLSSDDAIANRVFVE